MEQSPAAVGRSDAKGPKLMMATVRPDGFDLREVRQVSEDPEHRAAFRKPLQAWEAWARENPVASAGYLNAVRKPRGRR